MQGFRLTGAEWDAQAYRALAPKICVATWLVDVGRWYGVDEQQLMHVPMGLDHDRFGMRTPLTDRPVDVAMLHNPMPEKGWTTGLAALEELARRRPGFRAVVFTLGDAPNDALPAGVEVVTGLDQTRLAGEVYDRTKVMVQSSRHEGFGLTAIEAMACGAALVTTDCGGSRDYAVPGVTAAVVARDDPAALADATEAVLADDERRLELARAGERFVRRFDWQRSGELLEGFLEAYIADPARYQRPPGEDRSEQYSLDHEPARLTAPLRRRRTAATARRRCVRSTAPPEPRSGHRRDEGRRRRARIHAPCRSGRSHRRGRTW